MFGAQGMNGMSVPMNNTNSGEEHQPTQLRQHPGCEEPHVQSSTPQQTVVCQYNLASSVIDLVEFELYWLTETLYTTLTKPNMLCGEQGCTSSRIKRALWSFKLLKYLLTTADCMHNNLMVQDKYDSFCNPSKNRAVEDTWKSGFTRVEPEPII